jgi:hypothetical protein
VRSRAVGGVGGQQFEQVVGLGVVQSQGLGEQVVADLPKRPVLGEPLRVDPFVQVVALGGREVWTVGRCSDLVGGQAPTALPQLLPLVGGDVAGEGRDLAPGDDEQVVVVPSARVW